METITLTTPILAYPVGHNMGGAINWISQVVQHIDSEEIKKYDLVEVYCRGSSGAILASLLVTQLLSITDKIYINHVKKDGERSHESWIAISEDAFNIIIDDFASTGNTLNAIWQKILSEHPIPIHLLICGNIADKKLLFEPEMIITFQN